eukprot:915583-Rhodomonas_salina.2
MTYAALWLSPYARSTQFLWYCALIHSTNTGYGAMPERGGGYFYHFFNGRQHDGTLSPYALATPCPVLTQRSVYDPTRSLRGVWY